MHLLKKIFSNLILYVVKYYRKLSNKTCSEQMLPKFHVGHVEKTESEREANGESARDQTRVSTSRLGVDFL